MAVLFISYSVKIGSFSLELNKLAKILFPEDWKILCFVYDYFSILGLFIIWGSAIFSNLSFDNLGDIELSPIDFYCFDSILTGVL